MTPEEEFPHLYRAMLAEAERRESLEIKRLRVRCQELHEAIRRLKRGEDVDIDQIKTAA